MAEPPAAEARVDSADFSATPGRFRWLKLGEIQWTDERGRARRWETAERSTRAAGAGVDGVCVVARLAPWSSRAAAMRSGLRSSPPEEHTVLVSQFRPPVGGYVLELPAGLVDKGETSLTAAVRELKEETGYTANASALAFARTSPIVPCDPGLSGSNMQAICMKVDVEADGNADPQDAQEDAECIEKHVVPSGGGCVRAMRAGAGSQAGHGAGVRAFVRARARGTDDPSTAPGAPAAPLNRLSSRAC